MSVLVVICGNSGCLVVQQDTVRHAGRPQAQAFSPEEMARWYRGWQPLPFAEEVRFDFGWSLADTVERIHGDILRAVEGG